MGARWLEVGKAFVQVGLDRMSLREVISMIRGTGGPMNGEVLLFCESHPDVFCGGGVEVELVFLAEGGLEMGEGGSVMVFDEKIIDDEGEHEAVGVWRKRQAGLVEW